MALQIAETDVGTKTGPSTNVNCSTMRNYSHWYEAGTHFPECPVSGLLSVRVNHLDLNPKRRPIDNVFGRVFETHSFLKSVSASMRVGYRQYSHDFFPQT